MHSGSNPPTSTAIQPTQFTGLAAVAALVVLLACALIMSPAGADADLWGHIQYARDALDGGLPETTTYSYTARGFRWINHENLAELVLALVADFAGPTGLLAGRAALAIIVLGLMMNHAQRRGAGLAAAELFVFLAAVNLIPHWSVRPQLASYLCFTLLLALLAHCFHGWEGSWRLLLSRRFGDRHRSPDEPFPYSSERMRRLWLAPLLFLFWANAHGGFVAGLCIFAAYLAFRSLELLTSCGRAGLGIVRRFAMMWVAAALATLINPYGPRLHLWLLESLTIPRPEITEWHAPDLTDPLFLPLWLLLATGSIALVRSRRPRDFTHLAVLAIILWQSLEHRRHIAFLVIAAGFWLTVHLDSVLSRLSFWPSFKRLRPDVSRLVRFAGFAFLCLAGALLGRHLVQRIDSIPVARDQYPVSAVAFMSARTPSGRLVVTYNWAQYVIAALGPRGHDGDGILVGFDGRFRTCYPQHVVDMHFDFIQGPRNRHRGADSPPPDPARVLRFGQPDLVLINRYQPHSVRVIQSQRDRWALLYQDRVAQLWGRRDKYDDPSSTSFVDPALRVLGDAEQTGAVDWPALPRCPGRPKQLAQHTAK